MCAGHLPLSSDICPQKITIMDIITCHTYPNLNQVVDVRGRGAGVGGGKCPIICGIRTAIEPTSVSYGCEIRYCH